MWKQTYRSTLNDVVRRGEEVFDNVWNVLEHPDFPFITLASTTNGARNFPPYNIIEQKDGKVVLEMAVAGYSKDRLEVGLEGNTLIIKGLPKDDSKEVYRHKGISNATFLRTFDMNTFTIIESVELKDGLLTLVVSTKKPEEKKVKLFDIK